MEYLYPKYQFAVRSDGQSSAFHQHLLLPSQQNYSLQLGLTSWLTKGLYIEPTVSFSLNGNDSVTFGLQIPYTF